VCIALAATQHPRWSGKIGGPAFYEMRPEFSAKQCLRATSGFERPVPVVRSVRDAQRWGSRFEMKSLAPVLRRPDQCFKLTSYRGSVYHQALLVPRFRLIRRFSLDNPNRSPDWLAQMPSRSTVRMRALFWTFWPFWHFFGPVWPGGKRRG